LGVILEIPGVDRSKWSHERDFINRLVLNTCVKYEDVAEAVFQATNSMSTSSFGLQILLAAPTGTLPTRGTNADIEHLNTILNGIHARVEMSMIHTMDVDFTALVSTCFVRFTSEPLVTVGCQLYSHGGEVRRVLLQDDLTGQTYEVDLMLYDPKFCHNCGATADACPPISFNDSARQPLEHPRVKHKDVSMLEDTRLAFAPREQMPPCDAPGFDHQEVHEVPSNGGKTSKAIFCNKADCLACQIETTPSSLVWQSSN
jgi:NAD-dependent dihydropyrimidine dehydrogenase PreA subunit